MSVRRQKFWKWVKELAERKEHEAYMDRRHCDQRCPHCKTWQGPVGGWKAVHHHQEDHWVFTCNRCGQDSNWVNTDLMWMHESDINPAPTQEGEKP